MMLLAQPGPYMMADPYTLQLGVRLAVVLLCTCLAFFLLLYKAGLWVDNPFSTIHT
jgi:hypothetical protein